MRIALLQCPSQPNAVATNLERLAAMASQAVHAGVALLICPEMYLTGYDLDREVLHALAQAHDGEYFHQVGAIARREGIAIVYGYPEIDAAGQVFNAVQFVDELGVSLGRYRKMHLFGSLDQGAFSASTCAPALVKYRGWNIGLLICYDIEFPESARYLAVAGADLIVVPTANMEPYRFVATHVVACRAYENQLYVAYANFCGVENSLTYCGLSGIAAPSGALLNPLNTTTGLIVADLDRQTLQNSRNAYTFLADRRSDLLG